MATQSTANPNSLDDKPQDPASEVEQSTSQDVQDSKHSSPTTFFINSEPMREEQVQNAMKFLSHPKVRGSPVIYRRSFLEKKGLTKEEIDEAFRRVPDPSPSTQAASINQDGLVKSPTNVQPQAQIQTLQPAAAAPTGVISSAGPLTRYQFHWSHAFIAVGVLAASGAGTAMLFKNAIVPRLKSWIRKIVTEEETDLAKQTVSKPNVVEEAAAAAKATAAATADVAKASQEMLIARIEEKRYFEDFRNLLELQVQEMKSMSKSIQKLEVRSSSSPTYLEPSAAPYPKSYINDLNDPAPNRNLQPANPRFEQRTKQAWEVDRAQYSAVQVPQSRVSGESLNGKVQDNGVTYQLNGNSSVPWWQQKNDRITELETEDELRYGSYGAQTTEPPPPVTRTWVPPQPPPVVMSEAAEAIRWPKPSVQREQLTDDRPVAHPSDVIDELQRVTKISESGGLVETNSTNSMRDSSEIQEEHEPRHEEN